MGFARSINFPCVMHQPCPWQKRLVFSQSRYRKFPGVCGWRAILAGFSSSFAPCPVSAIAGHYDDEVVIYLRQRVVNVMQSGCRVVSHLTGDFYWLDRAQKGNERVEIIGRHVSVPVI